MALTFSWEFATFPDTQEMVVEVPKDTGLAARICMEAFEHFRTGSERGDRHCVTLPEPTVGLPLQVHKDTSHLFFKKRYFLLPAGLTCTSL